MTQDTWAYVTCNAGRVDYSIFDARDMRVAHGAVALSEFGPHEPKDVLRSLDVSFAVLDGAFAGQPVTCPASLGAPIEIGDNSPVWRDLLITLPQISVLRIQPPLGPLLRIMPNGTGSLFSQAQLQHGPMSARVS